MTNPPALAARVRHYVTLGAQVVPVIILVLAAAGNFKPIQLAIAAPLLLALFGPVLELFGKSDGRVLTIMGLGLQVVGVGIVVVMIFSGSMGKFKVLGTGDIFAILLILSPLMLLVWNLVAGRSKGSPPSP